MICENISVKNNKLYFGGVDTVSLAKKYGTPLYIMDEDRIRHNCNVYKNAMNKYFDGNAMALYASKAASFKRIYEIMKDEKMGIDVVSAGEIYTALKAGLSLENTFFHSNNKTDFDVEFAIKNKVGYFVVDNAEELEVIEKFALQYNINQKILLRLTPGIDTHTYEAVNTGKVDSKFGTAIETGQAEEMVKYALTFKNINLCGFHCHVGSQVFDSDTFFRSSEIMLGFIADMKEKYGYEADILNLGGGYGVRYIESDPVIDIDENIREVSKVIKDTCLKLGIKVPMIIMEPGRSIVADAGMTLYTVGTVKKITGYKNYVSIDGGMTDNPRYALYGSQYTVYAANKAEEERSLKCSVVGRCCESGDIIQENIMLPETKRGDIVAVCTTGAYNYSMSSNYNRIARPPIVMLKGGKDYVAVKRETLEDIVLNDI
ncbi:MAG: diaminopimelate decarboxylase [Clostridia bacterium]|nr:diaminopimelate decarboxylase [Clostridia bacterium]